MGPPTVTDTRAGDDVLIGAESSDTVEPVTVEDVARDVVEDVVDDLTDVGASEGSLEVEHGPVGSSGAGSRAQWRQVAIPSEHGGWGLTLEPAVLGLIVAPTWAGLALGLAAMVAFVARTPIKIVLVDSSRKRSYGRTRLAMRVAVVEIVVLAALVVTAFATAESAFWWPLAIATPMLGVELWYSMHSRSRRLAPEMAGTIGIGSVAAAIILAGGGSVAFALGAWLVVIARAAASVPFSRLQIRRLKGHNDDTLPNDASQFLAVTASLVGWQVGWLPASAAVAVGILGLIQFVMVRKTPPKAAILGVQQMVVGLGVAIATAVGMVHLT